MPDYLRYVTQLSYWTNPVFWTGIGILATYRISHLLSTDRITRGIRKFFRVQEDFDQDLQPNFIAKVLVCFWCTSVWVSLFIFLYMIFLVPVAMIPFAFAGGALVLEEISS